MKIDTLSTSVEDLPGEIWKFIDGYGFNYQVSNYGRVKSLVRTSFGKTRPKILKKNIYHGRHMVLLYKSPGVPTGRLVGRLSCSFNGDPEENDVVMYRDGNKLNDVASNLYWKSKKESVRDTIMRLGCKNRGENHGMAKLNTEKVKEIKRQRASGKSYKVISSEFNVSISAIQSVVRGLTWKNV